MKNLPILMVVACLAPASAQEPVGPLGFPTRNWSLCSAPGESVLLQENGRPANSNGNGNGNGEEKKGPEHMRDNAILVEEASNQEAGVVQHIFNWLNAWDRDQGDRTRSFAFSYTMELPIGSQKHQFSFTSILSTEYFTPLGGPEVREGGIGDTLLNYRYQLLADDDFLWVAPRVGLILPTGDERRNLGTGQLGYLFNLPVSHYGEMFDFHFNAGATFIPNVSLPINNGLFSPRHNLEAYSLGVSGYWKPATYLHFFVEALALWVDEIDDFGFQGNRTQVFLNPGLRYAVCQFEEVEWVLGFSVPIGLTRDTPDIGVFAYMSVEHTFRKTKNGKNGKDE